MVKISSLTLLPQVNAVAIFSENLAEFRVSLPMHTLRLNIGVHRCPQRLRQHHVSDVSIGVAFESGVGR